MFMKSLTNQSFFNTEKAVLFKTLNAFANICTCIFKEAKSELCGIEAKEIKMFK